MERERKRERDRQIDRQTDRETEGGVLNDYIFKYLHVTF